jgi:hypothetical protein
MKPLQKTLTLLCAAALGIVPLAGCGSNSPSGLHSSTPAEIEQAKGLKKSHEEESASNQTVETGIEKETKEIEEECHRCPAHPGPMTTQEYQQKIELLHTMEAELKYLRHFHEREEGR